MSRIDVSTMGFDNATNRRVFRSLPVGELITFVFYGAGLLVFWVAPLVSIFRSSERQFDQPTDRVLWFIVVFFLPIVGGLLYLVRGVLAGGHGLPPKNPGSYEPPDMKRAR